MIILGDVVKIDYGMGVNVVNCEDVFCLIVVFVNVVEWDLGSVVEDV